MNMKNASVANNKCQPNEKSHTHTHTLMYRLQVLLLLNIKHSLSYVSRLSSIWMFQQTTYYYLRQRVNRTYTWDTTVARALWCVCVCVRCAHKIIYNNHKKVRYYEPTVVYSARQRRYGQVAECLHVFSVIFFISHTNIEWVFRNASADVLEWYECWRLREEFNAATGHHLVIIIFVCVLLIRYAGS